MAQHAQGHRLRKGRFSASGHAYLLTTVTAGRQALFADFYLARQAIGALRGCDALGLSHTLAFVLMPDHLHWLVQMQSNDLPGLMRRFKSGSALRINRWRGTPGQRVWQSGFHDRGVREGQDVRVLARYVVANPLRAGLVRRVEAYPHWDVVWMGVDAGVL